MRSTRYSIFVTFALSFFGFLNESSTCFHFDISRLQQPKLPSFTYRSKKQQQQHPNRSNLFTPINKQQQQQQYPTILHTGIFLDVPDDFFTTTLMLLTAGLYIMKPINRQIREEKGWQMRIDEERTRRLEEDPTLTEIDLMREEADLNDEALYGPYSTEGADDFISFGGRGGGGGGDNEEEEEEWGRGRGRSRVKTKVKSQKVSNGRTTSSRKGRSEPSDKSGSGYFPMTDEEIREFESSYGVSYDPYYDEPYEEDELPTKDVENYYEDKVYGDRRYENGDVFYKDADTGLFWRQGCSPRIKKGFGF